MSNRYVRTGQNKSNMVETDVPCRENIKHVKDRLKRQEDNLELLLEVQDRGLVHYENINMAIGELYVNIYHMKKEVKQRKAEGKKK